MARKAENIAVSDSIDGMSMSSWSPSMPPLPDAPPPPMPEGPPPLLPIAPDISATRPPCPPVPTAKARTSSSADKKRLRQKTKDAAVLLAKKEEEELKESKHMTKTQKKELKKQKKAAFRAKLSRDLEEQDLEKDE